MEFNFSPSDTSALIAASAALLGVCMGLLGQYMLNWFDHRRMIQGVLRAIYVELHVIRSELDSLMVLEAWDYFEQNEDSWKELKLSDDKKPYFYYNFPASVDLSIVYRSNASLIGHIKKPPHLRERIVKTYTLLHALLDSYRINNLHLDQYEEARSKGNTKSANMFRSRLQELAPTLKGNHDFVSTSILRLIHRIEEEMPQLKDEYFADDNP